VNGKYVFTWADRRLELKLDSHDWILSQSDESALRIIPIVWFGESIEIIDSLQPDCIVCWPGPPERIESDQYLPISPLDLYVVEKMGRMIDEWMVRHLLKDYGRNLGPLPTHVKQLTDTWSDNFENVSETHVRLIAPLDEQQSSTLKASLRASANAEVKVMVVSAIEQTTALSKLCGHTASFKLSQHGFYCECVTCKMTWSLNIVGKHRHFLKRLKSASKISETNRFDWCGRDWLEFDLDS
jgi:hypothetical protein